MRSITRPMFRILNNEKLQPVQFLDVHFIGTDASLHLTDYGEAITWGETDYVPISMDRSGVEEVLSSEQGESPQSTVTISNIDLQMAELLNGFEINGAMATLWMADRRLLGRRRDAILLAQGEVREPQLTPARLICQIVNVIGLSERLTLPRRVFQRECGYTLGSRSCGVSMDAEPHTLRAVAQTGSTSGQVIVGDALLGAAGNPADASNYWAAGYVLMESGVCSTQARPVDYVVAEGGVVRFMLRYPFYRPIAAGDYVMIRRGCRKTKDDCKGYGNLINYGGFTDVPPQSFKPLEVKG